MGKKQQSLLKRCHTEKAVWYRMEFYIKKWMATERDILQPPIWVGGSLHGESQGRTSETFNSLNYPYIYDKIKAITLNPVWINPICGLDSVKHQHLVVENWELDLIQQLKHKLSILQLVVFCLILFGTRIKESEIKFGRRNLYNVTNLSACMFACSRFLQQQHVIRVKINK